LIRKILSTPDAVNASAERSNIENAVKLLKNDYQLIVFA
jgi:rRNA processing protein Krr1/Pno1